MTKTIVYDILLIDLNAENTQEKENKMTNIIAQTLKNAGFKVWKNNHCVLVSLSSRKVNPIEIRIVLERELEGIQFNVRSAGNEVEIR